MNKKTLLIALLACCTLFASCVRAPEEAPERTVETARPAPEDEFVSPEDDFSPEEGRNEGSSEEEQESLSGEREEETPTLTEPTREDSEGEPLKDQTEEQEEKPEIKVVRYVLSLVDGLTVRAGAGTSFSALGYLDRGDMVALYGKMGNWYETRYRGKKAYVSASEKYVLPYETERTSDAIESVIAVGCEKLGAPYVYGATRLHNGNGVLNKNFNDDKFDCSSLMQYAFYYGAGVNLQVNTRTQVKQGTDVPWEEIRRGDLLFFTNASRVSKTGVERIGHVALYLGDGYVLHTASDHAVIEKISAKRRSYFICARRILDKE